MCKNYLLNKKWNNDIILIVIIEGFVGDDLVNMMAQQEN